MTSEKRLARIAGSQDRRIAGSQDRRIAGSLYLVVAVFGVLAEVVVRAGIVAPGAVGELTFVAWLLAKGVRVPDRAAPVPAMG
jgi:hypothetical protein